MTNYDNLVDSIMELDHPMARKLKELYTDAFNSLTTKDAEKFLAEWQQNNPKQAKELNEFIASIEIEYKESRREVSSKLGYSRIGLGNV